MSSFVIAVGAAIIALNAAVDACTLIAVGKNATTDGSTLIAHTDDAGGGAADVRLVRVPAATWPANSKRPVYSFNGGFPRLISDSRGPGYTIHDQNNTTPMGYIPQVNHTYGYFDQDYGMMNDVQLAIGESTCAAKTVGWPLNHKGGVGYNLFGIAELSKVALERCDSAKCAIKTMGDLAVQYGFFSEDSGDPANPGYINSAESLAIADKYGEVWVFHILTGIGNSSAIWAAAKVPDTQITAVPNTFVIRQMNLSDTSSFLSSPNITEIAKEQGWWDPQTTSEFDFTAAFGVTTPGPLFPLYTGRRIWRVFDLVAPSAKLDPALGALPTVPTYPFAITPDVKVDRGTIMKILQDYYQGTEFDTSVGIAAGPFGNPVRFDGPSHNVSGGWERPISMYRTMFSFVLQSYSDKALPDDVAGTIWYGQASPHGSVYVPFSCSQDVLPESYTTGKESEFSTESAWWAFSFVNNWSYLRFNMMRPDILAEQNFLQAQAFKHYDALVAQVKDTVDRSLRLKLLTEQNNEFAKTVVASWWKLAWKLVSKFSDGYILTGEAATDMKTPGYPKWWLQATSYASWPGKSYDPPSSSFHGPSFVLGSIVAIAVVGLLVFTAYYFMQKNNHIFVYKLQDARARIFPTVVEMGNECSRGPIKPAIERLIPTMDLASNGWAVLLAAYNVYHLLPPTTTSHGCFMTKSIFSKCFKSHHRTGSTNENSHDDDPHQMTVLSDLELLNAFNIFDVARKGIICSLDVFGGLALVMDAKLVPKFKFILRILDIHHAAALNQDELIMTFLGATRGLSCIKGVAIPKPKRIARVVNDIYTEAMISQEKDFALRDSEELISDDKRIGFSYVIEVARKLPDVVYYMYDLSTTRTTDIGSIISSQKYIIQELANVDYEMECLAMENPSIQQYIEEHEAQHDHKTEQKELDPVLEHERLFQKRRARVKRHHSSKKSKKRVPYAEQTQEYAKALTAYLNDNCRKSLLRGYVRIQDAAHLQHIIEVTSDYATSIYLPDAHSALSKTLVPNQVGCVTIHAVIDWFREWRASEQSKLATQAVAVKKNHWRYVATSALKFYKNGCNFILHKSAEIFHKLLQAKRRWTSEFLTSAASRLCDFNDDENESSSSISAKVTIAKSPNVFDEFDNGFKSKTVLKKVQERKSTLLDYDDDDFENTLLNRNPVSALEHGMHFGVSIVFTTVLELSEDELSSICKPLNEYLNDKEVLKIAGGIYEVASVSVASFQAKTQGQRRNKRRSAIGGKKKKSFGIQVLLMSSKDFCHTIREAVKIDVESILESLEIKLMLDGSLEEIFSRFKHSFSVVNDFSKYAKEIVERIFNQFNEDENSGIDLQELNEMQRALGQSTSLVTRKEFGTLLSGKSNVITQDGMQEFYEEHGGLEQDAEALGYHTLVDDMSLQCTIEATGISRKEVFKLESLMDYSLKSTNVAFKKALLLLYGSQDLFIEKFYKSYHQFTKPAEPHRFLMSIVSKLDAIIESLYADLKPVYPSKSARKIEQDQLKRLVNILQMLKTSSEGLVITGIRSINIHYRSLELQTHFDNLIFPSNLNEWRT